MKAKIVIHALLLIITISGFAGSGGLAGGSNKGSTGTQKSGFKFFTKKSKISINENSSWDEIKSAVKENRKLTFSYAPVFIGRPVSSFDACIDGDVFKTIRPFPVKKRKYVGRHRDTDSEKDGYMDVLDGYEILSYPLIYETEKWVCDTDNKRCKWRMITVEQDEEKEIKVQKAINRTSTGRKVYKTLFTKRFEIPRCE